MDIGDYIPIHSQDEINPQKPGDYFVDGLLYCGTCGKPKQHRVQIAGMADRIVPCLCDCGEREEEEKRQRMEDEEKMHRIERLRGNSMMAGEYKNCRFSSFIRREENTPAYNVATNYCANWKEMKEKNQGLLFYGPVGTGKSYTAACIANELLDAGVPVIMTSFVKILQDIRSTEDEGEYIAMLNSASLLIIDDLGAERSTDYALEKVYNVIDSRVRANRPMILTTNMYIDDMMRCSDIRYKRIYDRIFEVCFPLEVAGRSFREMKASERFEDMKRFINGRSDL